jgi:hypothetical protein
MYGFNELYQTLQPQGPFNPNVPLDPYQVQDRRGDNDPLTLYGRLFNNVNRTMRPENLPGWYRDLTMMPTDAWIAANNWRNNTFDPANFPDWMSRPPVPLPDWAPQPPRMPPVW